MVTETVTEGVLASRAAQVSTWSIWLSSLPEKLPSSQQTLPGN